ncbi:MAG: SAM-dependent methyltransferase [Clostridia bacterium]|nr:SAM-dependent methyltransferase [Clostridia bacterium]MBQ8146784.1 SAM-dependent methyltransferase [Clostridia bacterium]
MIQEATIICLNEKSKNPIHILKRLMAHEECPMHSPVHHYLVGASLLTAFKNAGGDIELDVALEKMLERSKNVPAGACGLWGACGAGVSSGMFISIVSGAGPLNKPREWGLANMMTSKSLMAIGQIGGPRCCKRDSYLSVISAVEFVKKHLGIEMELDKVLCTDYHRNQTCLGIKCPFHPLKH